MCIRTYYPNSARTLLLVTILVCRLPVVANLVLMAVPMEKYKNSKQISF